MSDRDALADLAAEYARCVDRGDPEGVAACFAPDGVLRIVNLAKGGKVMAERSRVGTRSSGLYPG